jgi:hypothetical protein
MSRGCSSSGAAPRPHRRAPNRPRTSSACWSGTLRRSSSPRRTARKSAPSWSAGTAGAPPSTASPSTPPTAPPRRHRPGRGRRGSPPGPRRQAPQRDRRIPQARRDGFLGLRRLRAPDQPQPLRQEPAVARLRPGSARTTRWCGWRRLGRGGGRCRDSGSRGRGVCRRGSGGGCRA